MKKNFLLTIALLSSAFCSVAIADNITITTDIAEDATPKILETIKGLDNGSVITFEKGVYNFYPEKAIEKYCYISNHNDELTRIAFDLENLEDITIDGGGSQFIFHGRMIPFLIAESKNIAIKNLSIDYAETFHSEGVIVAVNPETKSFDMSISEEYPYEIRNDQLVFVKKYYEHTLGQSILFDPQTMATAYQTENYTPLTTLNKVKVSRGVNDFTYKYKTDKNDDYIRNQGRQAALRVEEIKPGLVRIFNHRKQIPQVGMVLVSKGEQGANRLAPAFKLNDVSNFNAEDVTVYHAGGMGYIVENCENIELLRCVVEPSQGRHVSTTADATHFVGCRGQVTLKDCRFQNQLDDASNIHGTYQEVMDILGSNRLGMRVGHYQQLGFRLAKPGDKVGVVRLADSFHEYHTLTVKSTDEINGRYHIITFEEELPAKIAVGDLLENLTAYPDLLVEGCDISRNRARGLLLSTPRSTIIRNNYFASEMEALLLPVESSSWYESGNAANVVIEGNTFQDTTTGGMDRGMIRFHTDDESDNVAFSNIIIRDNTFNHFDNLILQVSNVENLLFEGNTITNSGTFPQQFPDNPVVTIQYSKDIKFKKNDYKGKATQMIKMLDGKEEVKFK
ncbi:MAG: right-handed parallel beta-helix repeat-containing protein [Rikenellaceae bacterium]